MRANEAGTGTARPFIEHAGTIGEGAEDLGDGIVREECQCEPVVAGGEDRFATREEAEDHARTVSEMFIVRFQNKPGGAARRLLPVRETK